MRHPHADEAPRPHELGLHDSIPAQPDATPSSLAIWLATRAALALRNAPAASPLFLASAAFCRCREPANKASAFAACCHGRCHEVSILIIMVSAPCTSTGQWRF